MERVPEKLPIKLDIDPAGAILTYEFFLRALIKKQAVKVMAGQTVNFEEDIRLFIKKVWNNGYDSGLAHMDKMHHKIDKELSNG